MITNSNYAYIDKVVGLLTSGRSLWESSVNNIYPQLWPLLIGSGLLSTDLISLQTRFLLLFCDNP